MIENCSYKSKCNGRDCDKDFCIKKYRLDCLYDKSLIPEPLRKYKKLFTDSDGTDYQEFLQLAEIEKNIEKFVQDGSNLYIHSSVCGNGKAQPDDALILAENGYVKMKDIKIGDLIYGDDGELHKVIGKYDRGIKDIYKITFNDRTSALCCNEHLWNIRKRHKAKYETIPLQTLINKKIRDRNSRFYFIPITKALNFKEQTVLISPYLLGILLGNGSLHDSCSFSINKEDHEDIINKINSELIENYEVRQINDKKSKIANCETFNICGIYCKFGYKSKKDQISNYYKDALRQYKLMDTTSDTKFIPREYLYNSINNRIELLKGLMDTDGFVINNTRTFYYSTCSKQLMLDIKFLIQSLGGTATIGIKRPFYRNKNNEKVYGKDSYTITIKLPSSIIPFNKTRSINKVGKQQNEPYRAIDSIEYVNKQHCYCIMTDNPSHLYLTNDCIVTHNTSWSIRLLTAYFNKVWPKSTFECQGLFVSVPSFLLALKASISKYNSYAEFINENILKADLVIWDDIATKPGTEFELNHLLNIINTRMNEGKSNIFTSNLNKKELAAALGDRLASRICNKSIDIELHGEDKRYLDLIKNETEGD